MDTPEQKQSVELLEARRIRRLEQKRQRTFRRRTVLLILFIILILSTILIVRGCRRRSEGADPRRRLFLGEAHRCQRESAGAGGVQGR